MRGDALRALSSALGDPRILEHAPTSVDGVSVGVTLAPAGFDALARVLRVAGEHRLAALVRGGGSRLGLGNPPSRADFLLSTAALDGIEELDALEGVVRVRAGTPLARLRAETRAAGWELPLDPPGEASTVGGSIAAAALGPRSLGFGRARDCLLGLWVSLATGARVRFGGRVVKNVTGYDLQKLYTGSLGTLGVIEAAWLRLCPLPERVLCLVAELAPDEAALARALDLSRLPVARAVALLDGALAEQAGLPGAAAGLLVVELAGAEAVVEATRASVSQLGDVREAPSGALRSVRGLQGGSAPAGGLRVRVDAVAARLAAAACVLREAGARLLVYPGQALLYAHFELGADGDAARVLEAARAAARCGGGGWRVEEAPLAVKRACDVFGEESNGLTLMRTLKRQYDPEAVLNPGRFMGGI
jgi:glycolate oxidase FAD binding subunit